MRNFEKMLEEMVPDSSEPFWADSETVSNAYWQGRAMQSRQDQAVLRKYQQEDFCLETGRIVRKKIAPEFFAEVQKGNKNFEFRKDEDGIQPGDTLKLEEYVVGNRPPLSSHYTGRVIEITVKYVLRDAASCGLPEGYCVIGF